MNVIQINCVYGQGSTGRLVRDLHGFLKAQGEESSVFYGRGLVTKEPGVRKLCPDWYARGNHLLAKIRGIPYGGCLLTTLRLIELLQKENPDIVHLQCINGYFVNHFLLLSWLKSKKIPTVLTLHAEFPFTGSCAHALDCQQWRTGCRKCPRWRQEGESWLWDRTATAFWEMQRSFDGWEQNLTVVSVSNWLRSRAAASLILGRMEHRTIYNGVNTEVFYYKRQRKTGKSRLIFHATPMFSNDPGHLKGGWAVLELARRMLGKQVRFLVAGKNAIRGEIPRNVTLLGEITGEQAMADWYARADVTLLTSARETFSMVCAESLCCGTPVVGFRAGGPEEICLPDYSTFVEQGDLDALEAAVKKWLDFPGNKEEISQTAAEKYSNQKMLESYLDFYRELLS